MRSQSSKQWKPELERRKTGKSPASTFSRLKSRRGHASNLPRRLEQLPYVRALAKNYLRIPEVGNDLFVALSKSMASPKRKSDTVEQDERPRKKPKASRGKPSSALKEDAPFPRGGASVLTPLEYKQIKIQAKQDVLFEQTTGKRAPRKDFEDEGDQELSGEELLSTVESKPKKSKIAHRKKKSTAIGTQDNSLRIESLSYKVCLQLKCWTFH